MIRQVMRASCVLLLLVVMLPAAATENSSETYEPGTGQYLVVLIDGATGVRDSKTGKKAHEPDVAKLGGKLLEKKDNVRLVELPVAAAKALRKEENVAYIQRIWRGEPLEDWDEEQGASSTGPRVQTDLETDLTWETGQYLYDGSGNIKKIGNDEYSYDSAGRLIQAKVKGTVETYKYDSFGNLVEKSRGGATGTISVDATSNRLTGETYDAAGNARTRNGQPWYTYDSLNMMDTTRFGEMTTRRILYGPDDERIAVIHDEGLARWKIRDFEGRVLREFKDDVGKFFVIAAEESDERAVTWVPLPMQYLVTPITAVSLRRVHDEVSLHDCNTVIAARVDAAVVVRLGRGHLAFTTAGEMPMTLRVEVGLNGNPAFEGDEEEIRALSR